MSRKLFAIAILVCAGCAVAPLGFYESAFPTQKHFCLRGELDVGRTYDDIPRDSGADSSYQPNYSWPMTVIGLDYSPVPYLTLGGELTGPPLILSAWGAGVKAKAVPLAGKNMAAAVLLRAGANQSESDAWESHYSYNTQYLVGGGIVSFGNPSISVGAGPKLVLGHVNISSDNAFYGNVVDYGGFFNLVMNYKFIGLAVEVSALSIDRPNASTRSLKPYGGGTLKLIF